MARPVPDGIMPPPTGCRVIVEGHPDGFTMIWSLIRPARPKYHYREKKRSRESRRLPSSMSPDKCGQEFVAFSLRSVIGGWPSVDRD